MIDFDTIIETEEIRLATDDLSMPQQRAILTLFLGGKCIHDTRTWRALIKRGLIMNTEWPHHRGWQGDRLTVLGTRVAIKLCTPGQYWQVFTDSICSEEIMAYYRKNRRRELAAKKGGA